MARHADLIAMPGQMPMLRPKTSLVSMPQVPPSMRFGTLNPSQVTGNRFAGATTPNTFASVFAQPETFKAPNYGPPKPFAPLGTALATHAPSGSLSSGAGSAPAPVMPPPSLAPRAPAPPKPPLPPQTRSGIPGVQQVSQINYGNPQRQQDSSGAYYEGHLPTPVQTAPPGSSLSAVLAGLAQYGKKATPFQIGRVQ